MPSKPQSEMTDKALNALVAEKVMGWRWQRRVGDTCMWCFPPDRPLASAARGRPNDKYALGPVGDFEFSEPTPEVRAFAQVRDGHYHFGLPAYSTDISAAWQVVEKMRAHDWLVTIKLNTDAARFLIEGSRSEYDAPSPDKRVGPKGACVCELTCMQMVRDPKASWRPSAFRIHTNVCRAICEAALSALEQEGAHRG